MRPSVDVFVLDASVAAKWYLRDEQHAEAALRILAAFTNGEIALAAPQHIDYEIASVLRMAVRRGRLDAAWARTSLIAFLSHPIEKLTETSLVLRGFDLSQEFDCAAYDGLYLALADEIGCSLIHADSRLRNSLAGRFDQEMWIEDLTIPELS